MKGHEGDISTCRPWVLPLSRGNGLDLSCGCICETTCPSILDQGRNEAYKTQELLTHSDTQTHTDCEIHPDIHSQGTHPHLTPLHAHRHPPCQPCTHPWPDGQARDRGPQADLRLQGLEQKWQEHADFLPWPVQGCHVSTLVLPLT